MATTSNGTGTISGTTTAPNGLNPAAVGFSGERKSEALRRFPATDPQARVSHAALTAMKAATRSNAKAQREIMDSLASAEGLHKDMVFDFGGCYSSTQLDRVREIAEEFGYTIVDPPTGPRGGYQHFFLQQFRDGA